MPSVCAKKTFTRSVPLAKLGSEVDREGQLSAELMWRRECGRPEHGFAGLSIGSRCNLNRFVLLFGWTDLEAEKVQG